MIEGVLLATGLAGGADWRLLALAAGALWAPVPATAALLVTAWVGRRIELATRAGGEVRFAESVVGELRAGASLRAALRTACSERSDCAAIVRRLDIGVGLSSSLEGLAGRLPTIGALVESAVEAGAGGGRMLPVFEEMLVLASAGEQAQAEMRTATAQVRASMWVLVGGPVAYMAWAVATGTLGRLVALPGGGVLAALGSVLFMAGVITMVLIARRR